MRDVTNWYFRLENFRELLLQWVEKLEVDPASRKFAIKSIREFLEPPVIYVKKDYLDQLDSIRQMLPEFELADEEGKTSATLVFGDLDSRERACSVLTENGIRYRTGKTLVPFRLTGNIEWGVPAPCIEGLDGLTIWVWPESLWAPISFTMTFLEMAGKDREEWKQWWCSRDSKVYQFLGRTTYILRSCRNGDVHGPAGRRPCCRPA